MHVVAVNRSGREVVDLGDGRAVILTGGHPTRPVSLAAILARGRWQPTDRPLTPEEHAAFTALVAHLAGQHDQKTHGRGGGVEEIRAAVARAVASAPNRADALPRYRGEVGDQEWLTDLKKRLKERQKQLAAYEKTKGTADYDPEEAASIAARVDRLRSDVAAQQARIDEFAARRVADGTAPAEIRVPPTDVLAHIGHMIHFEAVRRAELPEPPWGGKPLLPGESLPPGVWKIGSDTLGSMRRQQLVEYRERVAEAIAESTRSVLAEIRPMGGAPWTDDQIAASGLSAEVFHRVGELLPSAWAQRLTTGPERGYGTGGAPEYPDARARTGAPDVVTDMASWKWWGGPNVGGVYNAGDQIVVTPAARNWKPAEPVAILLHETGHALQRRIPAIPIAEGDLLRVQKQKDFRNQYAVLQARFAVGNRSGNPVDLGQEVFTTGLEGAYGFTPADVLHRNWTLGVLAVL